MWRRILLIVSSAWAFIPGAPAQDGSVGSQPAPEGADFRFTVKASGNEVTAGPILTPLLQGYAKQQGDEHTSFLFGQAESKSSPIFSVQRRDSSRFHADLSALKPTLAHNHSFKLETQLRRPTFADETTNLSGRHPRIDDEVPSKRRPLEAGVTGSAPVDIRELSVQEPKLDADVSRDRPSLEQTARVRAPKIEQGFSDRDPRTDTMLPVHRPPLGEDVPITHQPVVHDDGVQKPPVDEMSSTRRRPVESNTSHNRNRTPASEPEHAKPLMDATVATERRPMCTELVGVNPLSKQDLPLHQAQRSTDVSLLRQKPPDDVEILVPPPTSNARTLKRPGNDSMPNLRRPTESEPIPPSPRLEVAMAYRKPTPMERAPKSERPLEVVFSRHNEAQEPQRDDQEKRQASNQSSTTISWDQWYAGVARLSDPLVADAVEKHGNPAGSNRISVSIWRNHHLVAKLVRGQNQDFDAAVLEAYGSLDGNQGLEFPVGSRRQKVSFFVDNGHSTADAVSGVNSHTIVGDKEVQ